MSQIRSINTNLQQLSSGQRSSQTSESAPLVSDFEDITDEEPESKRVDERIVKNNVSSSSTEFYISEKKSVHSMPDFGRDLNEAFFGSCSCPPGFIHDFHPFSSHDNHSEMTASFGQAETQDTLVLESCSQATSITDNTEEQETKQKAVVNRNLFNKNSILEKSDGSVDCIIRTSIGSQLAPAVLREAPAGSESSHSGRESCQNQTQMMYPDSGPESSLLPQIPLRSGRKMDNSDIPNLLPFPPGIVKSSTISTSSSSIANGSGQDCNRRQSTKSSESSSSVNGECVGRGDRLNLRKLVKIRISQEALKFKLSCELPHGFLDSILKTCHSSPHFLKVKSSLEKELKLKISQISRSARQITKVSDMIVRELHVLQRDEELICGYHALSRAIIKRCNGLSDGYVYPTAEVARKICSRHPVCLRMILSTLHQVSPLTVPMFCSHDGTIPEARNDYQKLMKYTSTTDGIIEVAESEEKYLERQSGLIKFFAAFILAAPQNQSFGLRSGWQYLSRFLNTIPANRTTATALYAFLKFAGNSLYNTYKRQFEKLVDFIQKRFLTQMRCDDDDDLPVVSRLDTYISNKQYLETPEAVKIPLDEESRTVLA